MSNIFNRDFLAPPYLRCIYFWHPPVAIDLMVSIKALNFQEIFERATTFTDEDLNIRVIHINDPIIAKQEAGRPKDLDDLENLR